MQPSHGHLRQEEGSRRGRGKDAYTSQHPLRSFKESPNQQLPLIYHCHSLLQERLDKKIFTPTHFLLEYKQHTVYSEGKKWILGSLSPAVSAIEHTFQNPQISTADRIKI